MVSRRMILRANNVTKTFNGFPALSDVSFNLEEGCVLAVLGPSGSGKTTLLRCLAGLEQLTGGDIEFAFKRTPVHIDSTTEAPLSLLSGKIGFVFQDIQLWPHMTVLENIIEAPVFVAGLAKGRAVAKACSICERLGIEEQLYKHPSELSIGQQQRAAIARTLAMDPTLILMDEITSALDPEVVQEIATIIRNLSSSGITCIVVSHQLAFARRIAEEMVFLYEGKGLYRGSIRDVQNDDTLPLELKCFLRASDTF